MEKDNISNALKALETAEYVHLSPVAQNGIRVLADILNTYYIRRRGEINSSINHFTIEKRLESLRIEMTDYIVRLNNAINLSNIDNIDIFCLINDIYKEINMDKKSGFFKRKG